MSETVLHVVTVEGKCAFPIDMLRYDGLHPRNEEDADTITRSIVTEAGEWNGLEHYKVELQREAERGWTPKHDRWERKFSWKVTSVEVKP